MAPHLHMEAEYLELRTRHPFIIARGGRSDYRTIWVRLRDADGHEGWGEAAPSSFYGESAERAIRGQATQEEHDELVDEGIPVARFPVPPKDDLN